MTNPVVFVHGFQYDPRTFGPDHPEYHTYPRWREMLQNREVVPFRWFSNPSLWDAWKKGYRNHYRLAWALAAEASWRLQGVLMSIQGRVDIVCHSLGSRVTLRAVKDCGHIDKVLILNGAEYSRTGEILSNLCFRTRFYNVVVPTDDVLNTLARAAPGVGGDFLGNHGVPDSRSNWQDLVLDDDESPAHAWAEDHGLPYPKGDNPRSVGDHWYSFENEANWPLYRAVLSGEYDEWQLGVT